MEAKNPLPEKLVATITLSNTVYLATSRGFREICYQDRGFLPEMADFVGDPDDEFDLDFCLDFDGWYEEDDDE